MPPYYTILDPRYLLAASAKREWLGRIVSDHHDPRAGFTPVKPERFIPDELVDEIPLEHVTVEISRLSSGSISASLNEIATVANGGDNSGQFNFRTGRVLSVRLKNYLNVFKTMREDDEVRKALSDTLSPGGDPAYMVVGLLIWTDATLTMERAHTRHRDFEAQVPVLSLASAVAGVPMPGEVGDPGIAASSSGGHQNRMTGRVAGDYIFALDYKAIRIGRWALWKNPKASWDGSGPRGRGDLNYSSTRASDPTGSEEVESKEEQDLSLEMDEDKSVWYDTVLGLQMDEAEVGGIFLAVEKKAKPKEN